jgi:hypothetical protein
MGFKYPLSILALSLMLVAANGFLKHSHSTDPIPDKTTAITTSSHSCAAGSGCTTQTIPSFILPSTTNLVITAYTNWYCPNNNTINYGGKTVTTYSTAANQYLEVFYN